MGELQKSPREVAAVLVEGDERSAELARIAARARLPVVRAAGGHHRVLLAQRGGRLVLVRTEPGAPGPVWVDLAPRRGPPDRLLGRAIGRRPAGLAVVDATAGLGRDAFALSRLGCRVTAVERHPLLAALLRDGLARAASPPPFELVEADARVYLGALAPPARPAVVYLDPMFPPRGKAALAKKEMQLFQLLVGEDGDAVELLAAARAAARSRVVVKRPLHAPPLGGEPGHVVRGRRVRWDVYLA